MNAVGVRMLTLLRGGLQTLKNHNASFAGPPLTTSVFKPGTSISFCRYATLTCPTFASSTAKTTGTGLTYHLSLMPQRFPASGGLLQACSGLANQSRRVTVMSKNRGKRKTVKMVVNRFRRLGNGLWLRRQGGYGNKVWRKFMKKHGRRNLNRLKQHIICTNSQAKLLDKLVTKYWKKQRWTVSDPYKGYDDHVKFYYNPFGVPGINQDRHLEEREYMWRRVSAATKRDQATKRRQGKVFVKSSRQKTLPSTPYFH